MVFSFDKDRLKLKTFREEGSCYHQAKLVRKYERDTGVSGLKQKK